MSRERRDLDLIEKARSQVEAAAARAGAPFDHAERGRRDSWAPPGYVVEDEIHRGGQGIVYRGRRTATGQPVAVKVLSHGRDLGRERFDRETRVLARLRHPGIVSIQDRGRHEGRFYCVMELVEGLDLDEFLRRNDPPLSDRVEICARIAEAVAAAHSMGVVHRDLKPKNIRIDPSGAPRVLDFGLARVADEASDARTATGAFVGSAAWASPEQVRGDPDAVGLPSDVYSLGVVCYYALTGALPYPTDGALHQTFQNVLGAAPVPPRERVVDLGRDLETILLKCLEKDPGRRYPSAGDVAREFRRHQRNEPIEARRDQSLYVLGRAIARHRGAALALALLLLTASAFSIYLYRSRAELIETRDRLDAALRARRLDEISDAWSRGDRRRMERLLADPALARDPVASIFRGELARVTAEFEAPSQILAGAFLPDGRLLAGTWGGRVAPAESSALRAAVPVAADIRALSVHEPSGLVLAASSEGLLALEPRTLERARAPLVEEPGLELVSSAGSRILAATRDGRVFAWETLDQPEPLRLRCRHPAESESERDGLSGVTAVALSARGWRVATFGRGRLRIWRPDSPEPLVERTFPGAAGSRRSIQALALSPGGDRVAASIVDDATLASELMLSNAADGRVLWTRHTGERIVAALSFADDRTLAIAAGGGAIDVLDTVANARVGRILTRHASVRALVPDPRSRRLAVLTGSHRASLVERPHAGRRPSPEERSAADLASVPRVTISATEEGGSWVAALQAGDVVLRALPDEPLPRHADFDPVARRLAVVTQDGLVVLHEPGADPSGRILDAEDATCAAFLDRDLVVGTSDGRVVLLDARTGLRLATLRTELGTITLLGFRPEEPSLSVTGDRGLFRAFGMRNGDR